VSFDDPTYQSLVKFKEVTAPNFSQTTQALYDAVVAAIRADEGIP
jgi:hypothetical protein